MVSGFGCLVSGFGFRVSGVRFRVSGLFFRGSGVPQTAPAPALIVRVSGGAVAALPAPRFRVSHSVVRVPSFVFKVVGFVLCVSYFVLWVSSFVFRLVGSELRNSGTGGGRLLPSLRPDFVFRISCCGFRIPCFAMVAGWVHNLYKATPTPAQGYLYSSTGVPRPQYMGISIISCFVLRGLRFGSSDFVRAEHSGLGFQVSSFRFQMCPASTGVPRP